MSLDWILALAGFAFVMSISPGPANFLLLTSGANFGVLRSLPLLFGVSLGFLSMVFAVGLGVGELIKQYPVIDSLLRLLCGGYVLWLAYKIWNAKSLGAKGEDTLDRPLSFFQASMLQLVNPKAWTVALLVTVTYLSADRQVSNLLALVAIFALVNIPSISVWAISGAALRRNLSKGDRLLWFNRAMALLLIASIAPMLVRF
ncbi:LysE family translocator [Cohaesibacter intestini]|uniref:LysE family translocator n=1 Tax=Cohaesibacter intestini TaxID=2211145 RepID=UPI000DEB4F06|nr:LysE family translocator [Cohaesibacter intestini]